MKIRLLFEPKLAVYISERQWHPSQTLKKRPDGRVELRMETTGQGTGTLGALFGEFGDRRAQSTSSRDWASRGCFGDLADRGLIGV